MGAASASGRVVGQRPVGMEPPLVVVASVVQYLVERPVSATAPQIGESCGEIDCTALCGVPGRRSVSIA